MIQKIIVSPIQKFLKIESLSGFLLILATIVALIWANSPYGHIYQGLLNYKIGFETTDFQLVKPVILWVNDGLMAIFFFLIGLEIKRELLIGELNSLKKITFPLAAAIGGMTAPVAMYLLLNVNPATSQGWGIPMATDIAFSLAVLQLLGDRVPLSLKIFLTAFAIVDDIGAVLVIAIFYSNSINVEYIAIALGILVFLYYLASRNYYSKFLLLALGSIVWFLFLKSGIHPTIAGILLAFSVPVRQRIDTPTFIENLENITKKISNLQVRPESILTKEQIEQIDHLEDWTEKYQSPLQHLEHNLHGWVAYFVIPIFALANAGVVIDSAIELDTPLIRNIILCLVIANSVGISTIVLSLKKLKWITIPSEITNWQIIGVSFLAGIGFTMSIFIAGLAFKDPVFIDSAKIGILIGSLISAILGYLILLVSSNRSSQP